MASRIYELLREVMAFQRAVHPLPEMMRRLEGGFKKYDTDLEAPAEPA